MTLPKDWKESIECLNSNSVDFVLVGAFAYHSVPRTTGDIDVLIRPTLGNGERLMAALQAFGFGSLGHTPEDFTVPGQFVQLGAFPEPYRHFDGDQWSEH